MNMSSLLNLVVPYLVHVSFHFFFFLTNLCAQGYFELKLIFTIIIIISSSYFN